MRMAVSLQHKNKLKKKRQARMLMKETSSKDSHVNSSKGLHGEQSMAS